MENYLKQHCDVCQQFSSQHHEHESLCPCDGKSWMCILLSLQEQIGIGLAGSSLTPHSIGTPHEKGNQEKK